MAAMLAVSVFLVNTPARASLPMVGEDFHLRFGVGVVGGGGTVDGEHESISFSGPGVLDGVQIGGRIADRFFLFFEADSLILFAKSKFEGVGQDTRDVTAYGFLAGVGLGYMIESKDIYLSAAFGPSLGRVEIDDDCPRFNKKDAGLGFAMMAGREWSVAGGWNAGVAGQLLYLASGLEAGGFQSHTLALGLLMTASFSI